jgi:cell division inhibitor SepF
MAGALRKTMLYLGLAEGEQEDARPDYSEEYAEEYPPHEYAGPQEYPAPQEHRPAPVQQERHAQVTPISRGLGGDLRRITTVHPRSYNDAKIIGEAFRANTPVIMNLTDMSDSDAKRLVDFSAGLVFGLRGAIERVTNKVFLLSPATVEIATSERSGPPTPAGFFNQS